MSDTTAPFRWGILGTGAIAHQFAIGLTSVPDAELAAVGSRSEESARRFAEERGARRAHGSYAALAADPEIDAIYVATPHVRHREDTLACLAQGKPVLCEKPFAMNLAEGKDMVAAARESGVFLMEAMWTRFLPAMVFLREQLAAGLIGEVRGLTCDFGFRADFDPKSRLFDPALGGGALLDVGVYCVALSRSIFGQAPAEITGLAHLGETGVDEESSWIFRYADGRLSSQSAAVRLDSAQEAIVHGSEGRVRVPHFWNARTLIVERGDHRETLEPEAQGNGYNYEAEEVARCVRAGQLESALMPLDESLEILNTLDRIRDQWGLRYPADG